MKHEQDTFAAQDGLKLFEQRWRPDQIPRAIVIIIHGLAEHSRRYNPVAEHLCMRGYGVEAFDLRGHGQSEGRRAFIRAFDLYLADLKLFLTRVRERNQSAKLFLSGHSMGGTIVTLYTITEHPDLAGIVLSAPVVKVSDNVSPLLVRISALIGALLPTLPTIKISSQLVSHDPEVVKRRDNDPLVYHGGTPARTGSELIRAANTIQKRMQTITLPMLILQGDADQLADPNGSKQLYQQARSGDKTLKRYEGFYHEVLNELEKDRVLTDLVSWLDQRS